jgi:hypothetical protein
MDTVQVVKEVVQLAWTMWPDDECIIHVAKAAEGLSDYQLLKKDSAPWSY